MSKCFINEHYRGGKCQNGLLMNITEG